MKQYVVIGIICVLLILSVFFFLRPPDKIEDKLEIFSWWTAIGEGEALDELYRIYHRRHPKVEIINATVVGGMGAKARSVLETRMIGGNPPDAFQVLAGPSLMSLWIKPGYLEDLSFLYEQNNLLDQFPEELMEKLRYKGGIYAMPVNIHRENVMWYNTSIFKRFEISPPHSMEELFTVLETLAARGITPLAVGDKNHWPALHLFESILVSNLAAKQYQGLWNGDTPWNTYAVHQSLRQFRDIFQYVNSDHAALTWDEAVQYMIDGKCAITVMGDFAEGYLKAKGLRPDKEFGFLPFPGSEDVFVMNSDTFAIPKGAIHRDNAIKWVELVGSKEGQDAFNPKKGSIPARKDRRNNIEAYDSYQQSSIRAFRDKKMVGSVTHGTVAPDTWRNELYRIIDSFIADKDIQHAIERLESLQQEFVK